VSNCDHLETVNLGFFMFPYIDLLLEICPRVLTGHAVLNLVISE
jgi:hypothetical protein